MNETFEKYLIYTGIRSSEFTVGGVSGYAYTILSITNTVVTDGNGHSMTVSAITTKTNSTSSASSGTLVSGVDIFM